MFELKIHETPEGKSVFAMELLQYAAYDGLFEGPSHASWNTKIMKAAVGRARKPGWREPLLIEPEHRPVPEAGASKDPFEMIPGVVCIAYLQALRHDNPNVWYELPVVWFQDELAPPIDARVLHAIEELDWQKLGEECVCEEV